MKSRLALMAILALISLDARAGLRPRYGGELVVLSPSAPVGFDPAQAWSAVEVALAPNLGLPLSALMDGAPELLGNNAVRIRLSERATWPDGTPVDARTVASALRSAIGRASVSLPPLLLRADDRVLDVAAPVAAGPILEVLEWPWLRLVSDGRGGAFRPRRGLLVADPLAPGGAPMADSIRVELYEDPAAPAPAEGLVIGRPGPGGRPVLAVPRRGSAGYDALRAALTELDRLSLVKLFVRQPAQASTSPRPVLKKPTRTPTATLVLAMDASERNLAPVAQRLQVVLNDAGLSTKIVAEPRDQHFARLARDEFDIALTALPPAPEAVQAATLLRLFAGDPVAQAFWASPLPPSPLEVALEAIGATHLYVEGGGVEVGARLRGVNASVPWRLELSDTWMAVEAGAP